jgi:hypothetical protein
MAKVIADGFGIKLHGKAGNVVFAQTRFGLVVRPRTVPRNPRTPAQLASRDRLTRASAAYRALTDAQLAAWSAYARTLSRTSPAGGPPYVPAAQNVFVGLAAKFLQVNPGESIPLDPPAAPFLGDGITVTASAVSGGVEFAASGPNAVGVVTELLIQPLARAARAPKERGYRPQAFVAFAPGSLSYTVSVTPGAYAPAIRFVRAATGQQSGLLPLPALIAL